MNVLWAPWRMEYIGAAKEPGCLFCNAAACGDPRPMLVLARRPAVVMLNKFPYANAHLLVAPRRHSATIADLPADEFQLLMETLQRSASLLTQALHPAGMNIGMNVGAAGGAGIVEHAHWHIVPRWVGDTNFMPMLAEVRVMPQHLEAVYDQLLPFFSGLESA